MALLVPYFTLKESGKLATSHRSYRLLEGVRPRTWEYQTLNCAVGFQTWLRAHQGAFKNTHAVSFLDIGQVRFSRGGTWALTFLAATMLPMQPGQHQAVVSWPAGNTKSAAVLPCPPSGSVLINTAGIGNFYPLWASPVWFHEHINFFFKTVPAYFYSFFAVRGGTYSFVKLKGSWCTMLFKLQVYNIVINLFKGHVPFVVINIFWLYSACCTVCPYCFILYGIRIVCNSLSLACPSPLPSHHW